MVIDKNLDEKVEHIFFEIDQKSMQDATDAQKFNPSLEVADLQMLRLCKVRERLKEKLSAETDVYAAAEMLYRFAKMYSAGDEAQVREMREACLQNPAFQDPKSQIAAQNAAEEALNICKELSLYKKLVQRDLEITNDVKQQTTENLRQIVNDLTEASYNLHDFKLVRHVEEMMEVWKTHLEDKEAYDALSPEQKKHYDLKKIDTQLQDFNCALRRDPIYLRQALAVLEGFGWQVITHSPENKPLRESLLSMERRWKLYYENAQVITREFSYDNCKVN